MNRTVFIPLLLLLTGFVLLTAVPSANANNVITRYLSGINVTGTATYQIALTNSLSPTQANVLITLSDDHSNQSFLNAIVPPGTTHTVDVSSAVPQGFSGYAEIISDAAVDVVGWQVHQDEAMRSVNAVSEPLSTLHLGPFYRDPFALTAVLIWNFGVSDADVVVKFSGQDCDQTHTIAPGEKLQIMSSTSSCLPNSYVGSLEVTATQAMLASLKRYDPSNGFVLVDYQMFTENEIPLAVALTSPRVDVVAQLFAPTVGVLLLLIAISVRQLRRDILDKRLR